VAGPRGKKKWYLIFLERRLNKDRFGLGKSVRGGTGKYNIKDMPEARTSHQKEGAIPIGSFLSGLEKRRYLKFVFIVSHQRKTSLNGGIVKKWRTLHLA